MLSKNERWVSYGKKVVVVFALLVLWAGSEAPGKQLPKACSKTTVAAYNAEMKEIDADFLVTVGNCFNLSDEEERDECLKEAKEELKEAKGEVKERRAARNEVCKKLGEEPYDPVIDPNNFVDFEEIVSGAEDLDINPYFPLIPGTIWEYIAIDSNATEIERIVVEVLEEVKEIQGVNCIVVRDRVWEIDDGNETLVEDTNDFFGQELTGTVRYFGEISKEYEDGELVSLEGSWKAGRDFAKSGIIMLADPQPGAFYRQEFALLTAEDVAEVISIGEETVVVPFGTFDEDILKTQEGSPLEPDVAEFKFYVPGIGLVLEENPETGERVELVDMTMP